MTYATCNPYSLALESIKLEPGWPTPLHPSNFSQSFSSAIVLLREARHFERNLPPGVTSIPERFGGLDL